MYREETWPQLDRLEMEVFLFMIESLSVGTSEPECRQLPSNPTITKFPTGDSLIDQAGQKIVDGGQSIPRLSTEIVIRAQHQSD